MALLGPPGPPPALPISERAAYLARVHIGTTIPLLALCLVPFLARIYVRVWPVWRFGWDDGFIVAGLVRQMTTNRAPFIVVTDTDASSVIHQVCAIADWALLEKELYLQSQAVPIHDAVFAVTLAYFSIPLWCLAMTLIKTSIVLTLLRLPPVKRAWTVALYILLAAQVTYWLANTVYLFAKCRPHHASWDFTVPVRRCPSEKTDIIVSSIGSAINIATDLVLSVAPMLIFWNLHRPLRERILICSLTGIGLFATVASILKAVVVAEWTRTEDRWATAISIATWTVTEQFVSILAACSPSLKGPIQRLLDKFGVQLVGNNSIISFVHVSSLLRERHLRRQAREWLGEEDMPANRAQRDPELANGVEADLGDMKYISPAPGAVTALNAVQHAE